MSDQPIWADLSLCLQGGELMLSNHPIWADLSWRLQGSSREGMSPNREGKSSRKDVSRRSQVPELHDAMDGLIEIHELTESFKTL